MLLKPWRGQMTNELNKTVLEAIKQLEAALDEERKRVFDVGAIAMERCDEKVAQSALDYEKRLVFFQDDVNTLLCGWEELQQEFEGMIPAVKENTPPFSPQETSATARAGYGQQLLVVFPDGSQFREMSAALTFTKTIEKIGSERVMQLGILSCGVPLVTKEKPISATNKYAGKYHETGDGYFVLTYSGTKEKAGFLNKIIKKLGLDWKVTIEP